MSFDTLESLSARIRAQIVSPVDAVRESLQLIQAANPDLNAFITVMADAALEEARALEAELVSGAWRGPLHGVPVAVKDFFDTTGTHTTAGSKQFKDWVPEHDAAVVAQLREAGAVIIGKTNMDALGMATTGLTSCFGAVRNPVDAQYVSGGSSAGSAAAVAAGLCYATIDTDAVGSTRLPASCCGVVGFKGSYGLLSTAGILGDEPADDFIRWMGHAGVTTRTVMDTALVLEALTGTAYVTALGDGKELRVGVGDNFTAEPQVRAAFDAAIAVIAAAGWSTYPVPVPFGEAGDGTMTRVVEDRAAIGERAFAEVDVIVLPTIESAVPNVETALRDPEQAVPAELTAFANYYGLPAISVPCGHDGNGMPIGLQIVARPGDDLSVLRLAHAYQQLTQDRMAGVVDAT